MGIEAFNLIDARAGVLCKAENIYVALAESQAHADSCMSGRIRSVLVL